MFFFITKSLEGENNRITLSPAGLQRDIGYLDQRPLRLRIVLQTKTAIFSFGGLRGL